MKGIHFAPNEQELQYVTFRRHSDSMLHAVGLWNDGNGSIASQEESQSQTSSGRTPVGAPGAKKKMTLAEYKNRDKKASAVPDAEKVAPADAPGVKAEIKDQGGLGESAKDNGKVREVKESAAPSKDVIKPQLAGSQGLKRYCDISSSHSFDNRSLMLSRSASDMSASELLKSSDATAAEPPAKKSCTGAEKTKASTEKAQRTAPTQSATKVTPSQGSAKTASAPPKISDASKPNEKAKALPEKTEKQKAKVPSSLPPMLSPDLGPEIEAELEKHKSRSKHGPSATTKITTVASSYNQQKPDITTSTKSKKAGASATSAPSTSASQKADKTHPSSSLQSTSNKQSQTVFKGTAQAPKVQESDKPNMIITLKIKSKAGRKQLSQYLKLKPTPSKKHWPGVSAVQTQDDDSDHLSANRKRRRSDENSHTSKLSSKRRQGSISLAQKAQTPGAGDPSTPSHPSRPESSQKTRLSTPAGNLKGTAMHRTSSGQGSSATPLGNNRDVTPGAAGKHSPPEKEKRAEYKIVASKYMDLATELKHDADVYLKKSEDLTDEERNLCVVIGTESILCFMLAGVIKDEPGRWHRQPGNGAFWKSIFPLLANIVHHARALPDPPHIYGLLHQLEAVIRDTIHFYDVTTLANITREYAKTEGSDNVSTNDQDTSIQQYHRLIKDSNENEFKALAAWGEGYLALPFQDMMEFYPKTFGKARRLPCRGKAHDPVFPTKLADGGFAVPLGTVTTGLDAVNFGLNFLAEVAEKNAVPWVPKLQLENQMRYTK